MVEYNILFQAIENEFSVERIRKDLVNYLELNLSTEIEVISINQDDGSERHLEVASTDSITIINVVVTKKYQGILYLPFMIEVIIGNFRVLPQASFIKPEKCLAQMFYDISKSLITVEFVHF